MRIIKNCINDYLNSKNRFLSFVINNYFFIYDSEIQNIYFFNKSKSKSLQEKNIDKLTPNAKKLYTILNNSGGIEEKLIEEDKEFLHIKLALSNICNLNCKYCFVKKQETIKTDISILKKLLDRIDYKYNSSFIYKNICITYNILSEVLTEVEALDFFYECLNKINVVKFRVDDFKNVDTDSYLSYLPSKLLTLKNKNEDLISFLNRILLLPNLRDYLDNENIQYDDYTPDSNNLWDITYHNSELLVKTCFNDIHKFQIYPKKTYISSYFQTNATLINYDIVQLLKKHRISIVGLSLDGNKKINDINRPYKNGNSSYLDVINGISLLRKNGIKIALYATITDINSNIFSLYKELKKIGVEKIGLNLVKDNPLSEKTKKRIIKSSCALLRYVVKRYLKGDDSDYKLLKESFILEPFELLRTHQKQSCCGFGKKMVIDEKGNVYPCDQFFKETNYFEGNIFDEKLNIKRYPGVRERKVCHNCIYKYLCGGECLATNGQFCELKTQLSLESIRLYAGIILKGITI